MMHVQFNAAWHGKMHKQSYKLSGAQHAILLHIDETPHSSYLVRSHLCTQQYSMLLAWQEMNHDETIYLGKFK